MSTNWRTMIANAMKGNGDGGPIVFCSLTEDELDKEFDSSYGVVEGQPFVAFTPTRVYFPLQYDGMERVGSAPRNPPAAPLEHQ